MTGNKQSDFGGDPDHGADPRNFYQCRIGATVLCCR